MLFKRTYANIDFGRDYTQNMLLLLPAQNARRIDSFNIWPARDVRLELAQMRKWGFGVARLLYANAHCWHMLPSGQARPGRLHPFEYVSTSQK